MLEKPGATIDPGRISDRVDFAAALTSLREAAGLTVRDLAKRAAVPTATVSGYLSGRHLPNPSQPEAFLDVLAACGVTAETDQDGWYCYTAVHFTNDNHVLLSYCAGSVLQKTQLSVTDIRRMSLDWVYQ